ncbi:MAG: methyltransferase domain-containing protein [Bacteroidota bacterium]
MRAFFWMFILGFAFCTCDTIRSNRAEQRTGIDESYAGTQREIWQQPEMIIDRFGDLSNKTAVDLGTGYGYFALFLANHAEQVLALDINQEFVTRLDSIAQVDSLNIDARLVKRNDPLLAPAEADAVMMGNTYMFIEDRINYLNTLKKGMKKGGKLIIVDFKKKQTRLGPPTEGRVPLYEVEQELNAAGFMVTESNDTALDYQYIIVAVK